MSDLREKVIRLAHQQPELREHLLPLIGGKTANADSLNSTIKAWWASLAKKINGNSMKVVGVSDQGLKIQMGNKSDTLHVFAENGKIQMQSRSIGKPSSNLTMDMSQKYIAESILELPNFLARLANTKIKIENS